MPYRFAAPVLALISLTYSSLAQPPLAQVVLSTIEEGSLAPQSDFKGSIYFKDVAEVACEVEGKVKTVHFEAGGRVKKGQPLATLDVDLRTKQREAAKAAYDRSQTLLRDAEVRLRRIEELLQDEVSTQEQHDEMRFNVQALRQQSAGAKAELDRIGIMLEKSVVPAPFDGVVLRRQTEVGEWQGIGDVVATLASEASYIAMIDLPEEHLSWLAPGMTVPVTVAGQEYSGTLENVIPRGDIATRTFPLRIVVSPPSPLMEGMTARARLPIGPEQRCLVVPRDAVLYQGLNTDLFTVADATAKKHQVRVLGFEGNLAGVEAAGLSAGMRVIVKGHERLRDGAAVAEVTGGAFAPAQAHATR